MPPGLVVLGRPRVIRGPEVVQDDGPSYGQPSVGRVERWALTGLFALSSAIEDEKIERAMGAQLAPVAVDDFHIRVTGEESSRQSCAVGVDLDAHERGGRV